MVLPALKDRNTSGRSCGLKWTNSSGFVLCSVTQKVTLFSVFFWSFPDYQVKVSVGLKYRLEP